MEAGHYIEGEDLESLTLFLCRISQTGVLRLLKNGFASISSYKLRSSNRVQPVFSDMYLSTDDRGKFSIAYALIAYFELFVY